MTRKVWKYELLLVTEIDIAPGFQVVAVGRQNNVPHIWIEHDPEAESCPQRFIIYVTGEPIAPHHRWVGTLFDRQYVWHVYHDPSVSRNGGPITDE